MPSTPAWSAALNGIRDNLDATNHATQAVQELGTHAVYPVYQGNQLLSTLSNTNTLADGEFFWIDATLPDGNLLVNDLDQPFVMPAGATSLGRIKLALKPIGNGADIRLTLYPDNAGAPNTASPIASAVIPKEQITTLGAPLGLTAPTRDRNTAEHRASNLLLLLLLRLDALPGFGRGPARRNKQEHGRNRQNPFHRPLVSRQNANFNRPGH